MTTKEFIEGIANGKFEYDSDIIIQAAKFQDKDNLLWDLRLSEIVCLNETGLPLVTSDSQIQKMNHAIEIISESNYTYTPDVKDYANTEIKNKQKEKNLFFATDRSDDAKLQMFNSLLEYGYIHNNTTIEQWKRIFSDCQDQIVPIKWMKGVRKLSYFVYQAFQPHNINYIQLTRCFFIINGSTPTRANLSQQISYLQNERYDTRTGRTKQFFEYDENLTRIALLR